MSAVCRYWGAVGLSDKMFLNEVKDRDRVQCIKANECRYNLNIEVTFEAHLLAASELSIVMHFIRSFPTLNSLL